MESRRSTGVSGKVCAGNTLRPAAEPPVFFESPFAHKAPQKPRERLGENVLRVSHVSHAEHTHATPGPVHHLEGRRLWVHWRLYEGSGAALCQRSQNDITRIHDRSARAS